MGKFEDIKHPHRYTVYNQEMEHVFEEKDLGVTFDAELTFAEHIMTKARKANAIVRLTRRSFTYLDSKSFTNLHLYVRIWNTLSVYGHLIYLSMSKYLKRYKCELPSWLAALETWITPND